MKRTRADIACIPTPCKQQRRTADFVRLNVGGSHYDTTALTLRPLEYFEPILAERIGHALDSDGRIFIDRSGPLFGHILEWLRTLERPSKRVLKSTARHFWLNAAFMV